MRIARLVVLIPKLSQVLGQMVYGVWRISKLSNPMVTIFGGARIEKNTLYFNKAHDLAHVLADHNISILTGGGPGIMQAASCGATHATQGSGISIGIGVKGVNEAPNIYIHDYVELRYFFARKWLLSNYSIAFIIFPGGFGTFDELCEVLTLIQTKKMRKIPIILVGSEYWNPWLDWLKQHAFACKTIDQTDLDLITVLDSIDDILVCVMQQLPLLQRQ